MVTIHTMGFTARAVKPGVVFVAGLLLAFGCVTDNFRAGSGDVAPFIVQRAIAAGAKPVSISAVPNVSHHWRYFEDQNGVAIRMAPTDYPALEHFLLETFGTPRTGPEDTPNGSRYGFYRLTANGGVLQFGRNSVDGTHIEIIRPLTKQQSAEALQRTLHDKEIQKALTNAP